MQVTELAPGITSYENVMSDPAGFISDIEGLVEIRNLQWAEATSTTGQESEVMKKTRDCFSISLPSYDKNPELKNSADLLYIISSKLDEELLPAVNMYKNAYAANQWAISEGWQLLKYGKDQHFINHFDDARSYPRTVSMSFYLNDDYSGGEIDFPRFGLKIKPKANQMIMFPSNYVYNHTVHPVIDGTRYAVVAWWE